MYTRQSKDTSWRALSSDESTQSKNQSLLWVLSLLGSTPKCSELLLAISRTYRFCRCGFPFFFWPVVWGGLAGGSASYLYDEKEYGSPDNSSRPGGKLLTAAFQSNSTSSIFRILSDNTTVVNLISDIHANCSSHLTPNSASSSSSAVVYNSSAPDAPKPEQVVQYFRSSTVALWKLARGTSKQH
ncbi:hypothetical protein C8J55DRAFT_60512 [Lentinula edodes]|uniref:Uncharacterized protein n=1 Tax=Lentinula lateritia TaxID=40482 RepID=A0A9W9DQR7_9AGAR|nr:hypothetical protein C8J55DRAFT_60512 [Lentinula edodes]